MSVQLSEVGATADLTVNVPRDAAGDLAGGVEQTLRRVDGVAAVEAVDVTGLTPRLNDLRAEVTVTLQVAVERPEEPAVRATLDDGFGVTVEHLTVDPPP